MRKENGFWIVRESLRLQAVTYVVAFQKNAWNGLKADKAPAYRLDSAKKNKLEGALRDMPDVPFYGVPPTRLAGPAKKVLEKFLMRKRG